MSETDSALGRKFLLLLLLPFAVVLAGMGLCVAVWFAGRALGFDALQASAAGGTVTLVLFFVAAKLVGRLAARSVDRE
jgi:hypothetical protein